MAKKEDENWHIVGVIPEGKAKQIGLDGRTPIWIKDKIITHIKDGHTKELGKMKTTPVALAHKVVANFDCAFRQKDGAIMLAIRGVKTSLVTYIILELDDDNFWRVRSAHQRPTVQLYKDTLIWEKPVVKKKPARR